MGKSSISTPKERSDLRESLKSLKGISWILKRLLKTYDTQEDTLLNTLFLS